jgi:branched-chain amino acid aminotransferase
MSGTMQIFVNINGSITTAGNATISILDHGFLFGDNVYEAFRTYDRKVFLFSRHFRRLQHSAQGIYLELPWTAERFRTEIARTIEAGSYSGECRVRLIVTRGPGDVIADADTCSNPTVIIIVAPLPDFPMKMYTEGVEMTIASTVARGGMVADFKTGNLMHQVLATREAKARGVHDAILLTTEGYLSDGIACNIYLIQQSTLKTPGFDASIIEGITKGVVLDKARQLGMDVVQGLFRPDEIDRSTEMFLTSTYREVVPVVRVDGKDIGNGKPGPWTRKLFEAYHAAVAELKKED